MIWVTRTIQFVRLTTETYRILNSPVIPNQPPGIVPKICKSTVVDRRKWQGYRANISDIWVVQIPRPIFKWAEPSREEGLGIGNIRNHIFSKGEHPLTDAFVFTQKRVFHHSVPFFVWRLISRKFWRIRLWILKMVISRGSIFMGQYGADTLPMEKLD